MGIPRFAGYLKRHPQYGRIFLRSAPFNISTLCLDLNVLLHKVAQMTWNYGDYKNTDLLFISRFMAQSDADLKQKFFVN